MLTRNQGLFEERIADKLDEYSENLEHFGACFGKFDYVIEIRPTTPTKGYAFIEILRRSLVEKEPSIQSSISSLLCYPIERSKKDSKAIAASAFRTYSVFRMTQQELAKVFGFCDEIKRRFPDLQTQILWNPSLFSYVLKLAGSNFMNLARTLITTRIRIPSIRDFCTFVSISSSCEEKDGRENPVTGTVNVKLSDIRLLGKMIGYPGTKVRLGYFDLTRDIQSDSAKELLSEIVRMRDTLEKSDSPNWTGTVLTIKNEIVSGELLENHE